MKPNLAIGFALLATGHVFAGELISSKKIVVPEEEPWRFSLAVPGWMPGITGDVGIDGVISDIDVGFKDLINKIDMVTALRGEVSKGRFGAQGELIYMSLSDSLGVGGPVRKVDVRVDQYLADFALRWRLLEGDRGFIDVVAGLRYTNLYQHVHLQSDDVGIGEASEGFVDTISDAIRDRLNEVLTNGEFRNALTASVGEAVTGRVDGAVGADPRRRNVPIGPIGGRHHLRVALQVEEVILRKETELRAEVAALKVTGAARAADVARRVAAAKSDLEKKISDILEKDLNASITRDDDWWDPYVGLRARYNFTPAIYLSLRGDIGGFGIGSDLMWQAEAALGVQLTGNIFAEAGYRALSFDYEKDGLTYDTITHGAQVTLGLEF
jgi:hypothetical protein